MQNRSFFTHGLCSNRVLAQANTEYTVYVKTFLYIYVHHHAYIFTYKHVLSNFNAF